jgi:acetoin utilization deacetylase AcuC-like enzyme
MNKLKVFYVPEQNAKKNESYSPSATKPRLLMDQWVTNKYPITITKFDGFDVHDLIHAHDSDYVTDVLELHCDNGFGNRLPEVRDSLLHTNASMYYAARNAFLNNEVTCSPTSGFHHAGYDFNGGFCTFNGLMVASTKLLSLGAKKIGIVDLDAHYGNGTDDIIKRLNLKDKIRHYTYGGDGHITVDNAEKWLYGKLVSELNKFKDCDIILYQAGADAYFKDPLKAGALTKDQLRIRDSTVFSIFKELGIPVAWNLAGGYSTPIQEVLDIHNATLEECVRVYGIGN